MAAKNILSTNRKSDNSPLQSITDQRVTNLNQVHNYFKVWKQELQQTFHRRTDASEHFITWQTMFDLEGSSCPSPTHLCFLAGKSIQRCCAVDQEVLGVSVIFQHSARFLFDLWLFLLRWSHTPQAFLETSPPSQPLLLNNNFMVKYLLIPPT
ncbi:uncharacterized protein [Montipora foliosa]|uniref:uncharacterized protein n=1 Tax=Montipora foliosa TaxID=591990 RepID=UPI0035F12CBA